MGNFKEVNVRKHKRTHPKDQHKRVNVRRHNRKIRHLPVFDDQQANLMAGKAPSTAENWGDGFGVMSAYKRPVVVYVGEWKDIREDLDQHYDKLNNSMYATYTETGLPGLPGEGTVVIWRDGKKARATLIPTDKKGRVSEPIAAERLMDEADGDRGGRYRNVMVDFSETAKVQSDLKSMDKKERAQVYRWFVHPNESDVKGLDNKFSDLKEILSRGKSKKRHIIIAGGTKEERENIAKHIDQAFTIKEKKVLAGTLIKIAPAGRGVAGYYSQRRDWNGKPVGAATICIDPDYTDESGVIVHECIHALREHDKSRKGGMKHVTTYIGKDKDLEESMTEAETRSRQKPFQTESAGYYGYVKSVDGKSKGEMQTEDRVTINDIDLKKHTPKERNKRGKRAISATRKNYPKTHISKLKMAGDAEAIDSFYEAEKQDGSKELIQTYQPRGGKKADAAEKKALKRDSKVLYEWRDGKKVRVE